MLKRAAACFVGLSALGACTPEHRTEVVVRDVSAVTVAPDAPLGHTAQSDRVTVTCPDCRTAKERLVVDEDKQIVASSAAGDTADLARDPIHLRLDYKDEHDYDTRRGKGSSWPTTRFHVDVTTPRDNVVEAREVSQFDRGAAIGMLTVGAVFTVIGAGLLAGGLSSSGSERTPLLATGTAIGLPAIGLDALAVYYLFHKTETARRLGRSADDRGAL